MKDCNPCADTHTDGIESGLKSLIHAQLLLGKEVLGLLGGAGRAAGSLVSGIQLPKGSSCCDVPKPCWMPLSLGEIRSVLRAGDSATVCLVVTNGDFRPHSYQFAATGKSASQVNFSTQTVTLQPKERIAVTATLTVPRDDKKGPDCRCIDHEALIWVRGCRNHYLRWTVDARANSKPCCHEVAVQDDPDYVLHWYDHFYLARPCMGDTHKPGVSMAVVGAVQ